VAWSIKDPGGLNPDKADDREELRRIRDENSRAEPWVHPSSRPAIYFQLYFEKLCKLYPANGGSI
jgi:hypothetical protein